MAMLHRPTSHKAPAPPPIEPPSWAPWALLGGIRVGQVVNYVDRENVVKAGVISVLEPRTGREDARVFFQGQAKNGSQPWVYPTGIIDPENALLPVGLKVKSLHTCYDIVTDESCKNGDYAEIGSEDLTVFEPGEDAVEDVIHDLRKKGPFETSTSPWQPGSWYTETDTEDASTFDGKTGMKRCSYHLKGFTAEEEQQIYTALVARGLVL